MKDKPVKKNYKALLAVFILALIFWFMVKMNRVYDYSLDIPLKILINNDDIWLKYPAPKDVRVAFSGRGIDLLQLNLYDPTYEIDLSDEHGSYSINLSEHREYVKIPRELSVEVKSIIRPHSINFELDTRLGKKIPVKIQAEVETDPGFIWVSASAQPDSVTLIGPASYVDTIRAISTVKKSYKKIKLSFYDDMEIQKRPDFHGEYFPEKMEAHFDIQRLAEKEIENVPVTVDNIIGNYEVVPLPSVATIYAKGGEKILAEASLKDFKVIIDFKKEWKPGESAKIKAKVTTDLNLSYVESRPTMFDLIVQKNRK
jgi:YbbR domain-containing protein